MTKNRDAARANLETLYRIFTVPEAPDSTLGAIDHAIADDDYCLAGLRSRSRPVDNRDIGDG